ncbi:hypothetical protein C8R47DRAFT_1195051 [Mycena vitilis]|nr:hypothetical protein C8R47DRAFT_1195051 [Mycena vitilis]
MGQPPITRTNVWDIYMAILTQFQHLDNVHRMPPELDEHWGYALTIARDDHEDDIALIPNLTPLRNGLDAVAPDGSFYLGGVNNGLGLDSSQSAQLDQMMEQNEPLPPGLIDLEEGEQLMVWFSDEEEEADMSLVGTNKQLMVHPWGSSMAGKFVWGDTVAKSVNGIQIGFECAQ